MSRFKYRIIDKNGQIKTGFKEATDKYLLYKEFREDGANVVFVRESKSFFGNSSFHITFGKASLKDRIILIRNIGGMVGAGLPLSRTLALVQKESRNKIIKTEMSKVVLSVESGSSLNEAMGQSPKLFSPLVVAMAKSGEEAGNLSASLESAAIQMESVYNLEKKVKGALIYPAIIISLMIVIGVLLMIYVVPTVTSTFNELSIELPLSTRILLQTSGFLKNNAVVIFFVLVLIAVIFFSLQKADIFRRFFGRILLHLPIVGQLVIGSNVAKLARTMSSLVSSGVNILVATEIANQVTQNILYKEAIIQGQEAVRRGENLSSVFKNCERLFPGFVAEMTTVGEETGNLGNTLAKVAVFYETETTEKAKNLSVAIEPIIMITVGLAVGFFAFSVITPMYSLVDTL